MGVLFLLFGCKKEKGDETFIIPAEYKKTGAPCKIFLRNETDKKVSIKDKFSLKPNEEKIFEFTDTDSMLFDFGAKIFFGETGLEIDDKKGELARIGGEYWEKYIVPDGCGIWICNCPAR